jgi:hypothetical protein
MKHFLTESWVDFVRGAVPPETAAEMAHHMENCTSCARTCEMWRTVAEIGRSENACNPDSGSVRRAKAAFSLRKIWKPNAQKTRSRLAFDSFQQTAPAGIRGGLVEARQLRYSAGPWSIDIDLRKALTGQGDRVSLAGQVLKVERPEEPLTDFRVFLIRGQRFEAQAHSSLMGEFHFEFPKANNWKLYFEIEGQDAVRISLPNLRPRRPKANP